MFRKILSAILAVILITISLNIDTEAESVSTNLINNKPMKVAVLLMNFTDQYISLVRENLEEIQKENPEKVQFTFYDAKSNQAIQNEQIDTVLKKGTDLILLHLVNNTNEATVENVITDIKRTNTPVILFNREPISSILLRSYPKAVYIGLDAKQDGIKQGEILINEWNTNRDFIDKNNDNIMEYIILGGERDN
ncbi:substrate-binding domain-containing protein, partial [Parabacteroides distasonis]